MNGYSRITGKAPSSADFFVRLLLIVFGMEMVAMVLLTDRAGSLNPLWASIADALLVVILSIPLVWFWVVRPLAAGNVRLGSVQCSASRNLLLKLLVVIAVIELLVNLAILKILPDADTISICFADACLTTLLCAPLLWWILSLEQRSQIDSLGDLLGTPLKLYLMLLAAIFLVDLVEMPLIALFDPFSSEPGHKLVDAFLTTLIVSPLIWWLVVRPLRKTAYLEKYRLDALRSQVVEAIVTTDEAGRIDSFNPVAESAFGYSNAEINGRPVTELFCESNLSFDELIRTSAGMEEGGGMRTTCEISCRARDGSTLTMDVSLSRVMLEGERQFMIIMRDVSERKQAELSLRKSLVLLTTTLESTADAILAADNDRQIQTFNQKFLDMWEISRPQAENGDGRQLLIQASSLLEDPEQFLARVEELYGSTESTGLDMIRFRDGRVIERYSQPQLLEGRSIGRVWNFRDITDRTRTEELLRESEERFNIAISGTNEGIWDWNIETGTIHYTQRLKDILGFSSEDYPNVIGMFESLLHPEDRDRIQEAVLRHLRDRTPYDMECRILTREHGFRWFRTRGKAVWNEAGRAVRMAGFISDVSEKKMTEEALRQSSDRFRQLFEQSEDAIIFFKPGTPSIIDVNATAERLFGYSKDELKQGGVELLCRQESLDRLRGVISAIGESGISYLENIVILKKDGSEINVSMRGKQMIIQRVSIGYCTFRNITDRVRMEEKAREIQSRLIQANKMTSLGLLVSSVAHEINNPNNFIMANSQLLARMWVDAIKILREYYRENDEFLIGGIPFSEMEAHVPQLSEGIVEGSRRIREIIDNLKNFARQDRQVQGSEVDVNQVATTAVSMLQHEIVKFTNRFHLDLGQNIPGVRGSSQQLAQVIINLLMNACQSLLSREGGIWLTTGFDPQIGRVTLAVRDEGCGMLKENSSRIMEPFFTTRLDSGGTGLGLSICQSIVKEHGWSLDFISTPGKGSTFFVKIPVAVTGEGQETQSRTTPPTPIKGESIIP